MESNFSGFKHLIFSSSIAANVMLELVFPTRRDRATFRDKGTEVPHYPRTKGQQDKLKILPRDGMGGDSQNLGWDGSEQPKSGTGRRTKWDRAEKEVLKQEKDVLKQKRMF